MADVLRTGLAWLREQFFAHVSQPVTYKRGDQQLTLTATVGRSEFEERDEQGVVGRIETVDFLLRAADLVLSGKTTLPRPGDQIDRVIAGVTYRYEVLPIDGQQCFRLSDPIGRTHIRIHTKQIDIDRPGAFSSANFSEEYQ